jgi:PleD family two-component response regulator
LFQFFLSIPGDLELQISETTSNSDIALGPQTFKQAKIEHYLQRAEDYLQMARYRAALNTLSTVSGLDQNNSAAKSLQKRIEYFVDSLKRSELLPEGVRGNGSFVHARRRRRELVLVVDQDERVLTSLTLTLRRHGFGAVGAGSYDEAIAAVAEYAPDMVVSEVNFENGSVGYDLYLWIRTQVHRGELPFLFLATKIDRDTLIAGKRLGVSDFILKPLDDDLVVASILNCLSRTKRNGR